MTIGDVAKAYNIPYDELIKEFALPPSTPPTTPIKDLETDTFSPTILRDWLSKHTPAK